MKTAIMTDTNSGISISFAQSHGIFLIHMPVIIEDNIYYEGDNLTQDFFYNALTSDKKISTSQPSPGDVMNMWDKILASGYDELVYIPMSSGLSNSCQASMGYALDYDDKVQVVDNHRVSVTMLESVIKAKELADSGLNAKEIKEFLEKDAYNCSIYITVNTLDYLKKGGRITPAAATIASILSIKPILTIQGEKLDSFSKVRGNIKKAKDIMFDALKKDIDTRFSTFDQSKLHVGLACSCLSQEDMDEWLGYIKEAFPNADIYSSPLSASISCHTGPGAVGIGISYR